MYAIGAYHHSSRVAMSSIRARDEVYSTQLHGIKLVSYVRTKKMSSFFHFI